jgi:hypothetical protein
MKTTRARRGRKPKIIQVMPPPLFQLIQPEAGNDYWHVIIHDRQSDDKIHFVSRQRGWSEDDIVKAGGRELANGEGVVAVQRVENGILISLNLYAVRYAFGRWHIRCEQPVVSGNRTGIIVQPPFSPVIPGTTYEVYCVDKRYNALTRQWIAVAEAVAHVPGLKQPLAVCDYKTMMALAEAYAKQLGYELTAGNLPTI